MTVLYYMPKETDLSGPEEGSQYQHFPQKKNRLQEQKSLSEPAHEVRTASNLSSHFPRDRLCSQYLSTATTTLWELVSPTDS